MIVLIMISKENFYTTFKGFKKELPKFKGFILNLLFYNEVLSHLRDRAIDITKAVESLSKQTRSLDLFSDAIETLKIEDLESQCFTEYEEKFEEFIKFFQMRKLIKHSITKCLIYYQITLKAYLHLKIKRVKK